MKIQWHEAATLEFNEAALYYGAIDGDLGERFTAATEVAVAEIKALPLLARRWDGQARKARVRRFPFAVVYWMDGDTVNIVSVMHLHREPGYGTIECPDKVPHFRGTPY